MASERKWLVGRAALGLAALIVLARVQAPAAEKVARARAEQVETRMRKDITFLASDECEGRGPTTKGINKAADFIAAGFKKAGLKPAGDADSYFQHFTIPGARLPQPARISLHDPRGNEIVLKPGTDFYTLGLSHSGAYKDVGVVFAGYGISGGDKIDYDDYKGIDASGKVVVVLRDTPVAAERWTAKDRAARRRFGSLVEKMRNADKHGALAVVFVNSAAIARDGDDLLSFNFLATDSSPVKLPAFHLHRSVLESLLAGSGVRKLADIEKDMDKDLKPGSVALKGWTASFEVKVKRDTINLKNVIGVLEGKGPKANETVVVGAHYDHLGYGGRGSLAGLKKMAIHHGADDNGSGTTAILELARRFGAMPNREGRRLVFMCFSGEEMGLLGSRHYCKNPIFPVDNTVAMVNLDMVGRLQKNKMGAEVLQVWGVGTAKHFSDLIDRINKKYDFTLKKVKGGFGPSDHASFYGVKVPVFFLFTGDHPDYHRPSDTSDKINFPGLRRVTDLTEELVSFLATAPQRPEYVKVEGGGFGPRPKVRLGIRPGDYSGEDGILVGGVSDDGPAAKGGIKADDLIVEMGGKPIKNMQAYMVFMSGQKKGDTINVAVLRGGKKQVLKVKLD